MAAQGLRIVGLLGGIGSGKSTAARLLAEAAEGTVLDSDGIVSELLEDPQVLAQIELALGCQLRDSGGGPDRARLAERIFADPSERASVEKILHPRVRERHWTDLAALEADRPGALALLDVPLLLEGGLDAICDFLIFVAAPDDARAARVQARHGWSRSAWAAREAAQRPLAEKRRRADAILHNDAGAERLREECAALAPRLRGLTSRPLRERWPAPEDAPRRAGPS